MRVVTFTNDSSLNGVPSVKMKCGCGWVEKAYANRDARNRGERHLQEAHGGGRLAYEDLFVQV